MSRELAATHARASWNAAPTASKFALICPILEARLRVCPERAALSLSLSLSTVQKQNDELNLLPLDGLAIQAPHNIAHKPKGG